MSEESFYQSLLKKYINETKQRTIRLTWVYENSGKLDYCEDVQCFLRNFTTKDIIDHDILDVMLKLLSEKVAEVQLLKDNFYEKAAELQHELRRTNE